MNEENPPIRQTLRRGIANLASRMLGPRAEEPASDGAGIALMQASDPRIRLHVEGFTLFYSYLRIALRLECDTLHATMGNRLETRLTVAGSVLDHRANRICHPQAVDLLIEAMIERPISLDQSSLELRWPGGGLELPWVLLSQRSELANGGSLAPTFKALTRDQAAVQPGRRPRLLDIGGRARSVVERRHEYPQCDVTVFDIEADPSVDVVGDAHELGSYFEPQTFDFVLCVSVFEHLLMPWKVAIGMNRVMKPGAYALIHTHQTVGMHDLPWDFLRFSSDSWQGFFNEVSGFEVVETLMVDFMHIVPRAWTPYREHAERSGGFEGSSVILRKIGPTRLEWPVTLNEVIRTAYPLHKDDNLR